MHFLAVIFLSKNNLFSSFSSARHLLWMSYNRIVILDNFFPSSTSFFLASSSHAYGLSCFLGVDIVSFHPPQRCHKNLVNYICLLLSQFSHLRHEKEGNLCAQTREEAPKVRIKLLSRTCANRNFVHSFATSWFIRLFERGRVKKGLFKSTRFT